MVRLAIVGIGGYGWELIQKLQEVAPQAGCRLVAGAESHLAARREQAEELRRRGVALFGDAAAMFQALRHRCEAVYIASSIHTHAPLAIAAARAGSHVHLEKPPAVTVQEVDQMLEALEACRRMCLVGFQAIHGEDIRFVKERVVAGRLGRLRSLACHAGWPRARGYYRRNAWAGELRLGTSWVLDGPATNALSHQLINLLFLASDRPGGFATPTCVRAELYAAGPVRSHDTAALEVRTAEGPTLFLLVSHCTREQFGPVIQIAGERGRAEWQMRSGATLAYADGTSESCPADPDSGRGAMIRNFVEAVRAGDASRLRCPLAAARGFVLALDGAHESSERVRRVPPDQAARHGEGDGARMAVAGLDELLRKAAAVPCLLSDLPDAPPWAAATRAFDLAGYSRFPQRFAAD